jgi:D-3-phosphoglycerate dehydrogenase
MHIIIPDNLHKAGLKLLDAADGLTYEAPDSITREELIAKAGEADALIIRSASTVDAEMFDALTRVKVIGRAGVGVDNVDLDIATQRGVVVMNAPDGNTYATAEHTMAMMLALARHVAPAYMSMRAGKWDRKSFMGVELRGKTLGIVGFGRVGQAVAKRAAAFEMTVIAHDPYIPQDVADAAGVPLMGLDELFAQSDFLTLHAVVTDETRHMINVNSIAGMKDGVRIINVARGALIDDHDLAVAIKFGQVAGTAVDVYAEEPPPDDHPLLGLEGVLHTPHLGASTHDAQREVAVQATECVINALLHGQYKNVVNPAALQTT